ncbi:MAG: GNAT family N-acetyltransferase [Pseudomonadota bacterium]
MDTPVPLRFDTATRADLESLVEMLADDTLGAEREDASKPLDMAYQTAFAQILGDANNHLLVARHDDAVAGFLQLTFIPYLTYRGGWRCLIESVRVAAALRGRGVGRQLVEYAIDVARQQGCHVIQLTTDKQRPEAIRFYEKLGFVASHEGLKRHL